MKFSENGLYIERYVKCANCGVLIYEKDAKEKKTRDNQDFCSDWCVQWNRDRTTRNAAR